MNGRDPLKDLQAAARAVAEHITPGGRADRVLVFDPTGKKLLETAVPVCCEPSTMAPPPAATVGWVVTDRAATFDGIPVKVAPSRLRLLKVLAESTGPKTAKELTEEAFDKHTTQENTRYHIRELRKELKNAFTFDGDVIQGDDEGYFLALR